MPYNKLGVGIQTGLTHEAHISDWPDKPDPRNKWTLF